MATATNNSFYFRRRAIGRAASPPTWACYEEIPYDDDYSSSCSDEDSCSEDDEDYPQSQSQTQRSGRLEHSSDSEASDSGNTVRDRKANMSRRGDDDDDSDGDTPQDGKGKEKEVQKDSKGKQRAIDPEPEQTRGRRHKKKRQPTYTLRPILTIHRSQGFVWNQDLFVPPYAKDRYVASTSPPNARGLLTSNSSNTDYEVEVVEIRVKEGEMDDIFR
ncbi:hypothetical protein AGABI2DRAFT_191062 [Agaricus bisporus var. bisporus H97]|uniref:hypothetical protein n=1 Tax=Agaricus bisporus var. bisporus (strain H97 / ATCC MYA-4626 / FGSC 10389) TaxID=936046 RepID=UPI00029F79C4|nr:hypothetical protein AGABI2DRAFT_191062 [Agaricus bisporus var. bisporus H97]EKV48884.1 hypothetical protein AGABI2DRAFT_191062 [Agaricus bisporus var. bisporus H97]